MKALITGASSGIGRDMAVILSKMGYDLIIVARRLERLERLKAELAGNVRCISADLSDRAECMRVYEETKNEQIDFLINNAGFGNFGRFTDTSLEKDLELIDTNICAVHILTKLFLKDFVKRDSGRILNVASSAGFMPGPMLSGYYASKNYVVRLSEAVYEELRRMGSKVKISLLCPGPVRTEFDKVAGVKFSISGLDSEFVAKYAIEKALAGRLIIIPGITLKLAKFGSRFISEKALLKISYHIQSGKK